MAAEQAPEVKNAAVGILNFLKVSAVQLIMTSSTAQTGRRTGSLFSGREERRFSRAISMWLWWWGGGGPESGCGGDGGAEGISRIWRSGYWRREEGTEEERLEGMMRVVLKFLDAICLQSSILGKRWPCPKNGTTQISFDIFASSLIWLGGLFGLWRLFIDKEIELKWIKLKEEERDFDEKGKSSSTGSGKVLDWSESLEGFGFDC